MNIQELVKRKEARVIDVREQYEFESGHFPGAIHMPLSKFASFIDDIVNFSDDQVFYCRSGARSGQAVSYLKENFKLNKVFNGGSLSILESFAIQN